MKKKTIRKIAATLSCFLLTTTAFSSCDSGEYFITYTDDTGMHVISVEKGEAYAMENVPQRFGYEFTGLYTEKTGGTQYVDENGSSLAVFELGANIVLFPQYRAKEYTFILDYQGAAVTGERSMTVAYDSTLAELPKNLQVENKVFTGWYTEPNGEGVQVADEYGVLPQNATVNKDTFAITEETQRITLYAAFEWEQYSVTLHYGENQTETRKVVHGAKLTEIASDIRVNSMAVLSWTSDETGEQEFSGAITQDMDLYAKEYAPYLQFNTNGGEPLNSMIARAGTKIELPMAERENYLFLGWQKDGVEYTSTTMPTSGITLKAVWQAKLVFDENGGTGVEDISVPTGEGVSLPQPTKEGFAFAGWYTQTAEKYESAVMPTESIVLKAGWYEMKEESIRRIAQNKNVHKYMLSSPSTDTYCYEVDVQKYLLNETSISLTIEWHLKVQTHEKFDKNITEYANIYSKKETMEEYLIWKGTIGESITTSYKTINFSTTFTASDNIFIMFYCNYNNSGSYADQYKWVNLSDFYYIVHYPDISNLYL